MQKFSRMMVLAAAASVGLSATALGAIDGHGEPENVVIFVEEFDGDALGCARPGRLECSGAKPLGE